MSGRPRASTPGMLLTEPAGERHANHFGRSGARVLIIQPDPVARGETLRACGDLLGRVNHVKAAVPHALARRLSAEIRHPDTTSPLAIEALALELLAAAAQIEERAPTRGRPPRWLRSVVEYLQAHLLDTPDLAALTAIAGVHPAHLTRVFRRHLGQSMSSYLRRLRVNWAAERLASTDTPIADIAAAAGFADQSHFTREFHRQLGMPPGRYRRYMEAGPLEPADRRD
jgi:AraC family transcriptional regulator